MSLGRSCCWPPADNQPEARPSSLIAQGNEFCQILEWVYGLFPSRWVSEWECVQPSQHLNCSLVRPEQRTPRSHLQTLDHQEPWGKYMLLKSLSLRSFAVKQQDTNASGRAEVTMLGRPRGKPQRDKETAQGALAIPAPSPLRLSCINHQICKQTFRWFQFLDFEASLTIPSRAQTSCPH